MDKTTALKVLSKHYNAPYEGTFTSATSGDLIHDIMWEGEMGNTYHRWGKFIVEDSNVIPLAQHYVWTFLMNYTLKELQQRVNNLIEQQGENAHCAAWIYTKEDCHLKDNDGEIDYDNNVEDPDVIERIFDDVGNIDYIYQVIQESVDEVTEEQLMLQQQELSAS